MYIYIHIYIYINVYNIYRCSLFFKKRQLYNYLPSRSLIIIKEADKGSAVVVSEKNNYLKEAKTNLMIKMFTRNLQEMLKVILIESSNLYPKKAEIGEMLATTH